MGSKFPFGLPARKGGVLSLHGTHTAFSCCPALRLYWLRKSQRGIDLVSITMGNSFDGSGNQNPERLFQRTVQ